MSSSPAGYRRCSVCGLVKEPLELKLCSRCTEPSYLVCSKECQTQDWKEHKKRCTPQGYRLAKSPGNAVIVTVCNPGDKLCFMHTRGLFNEGAPELLAVDIPIEKKDAASNILSHFIKLSLTPNKVHHGFKFQTFNYSVVLLEVEEERQRQQLIASMDIADTCAQVRLVKPFWDVWESLPAPNIYQEQILGKWRQYREANPPPIDDSAPVSAIAIAERLVLSSDILKQALLGTEWKKHLTPKQVKHVMENRKYMLRMGLSGLCFPPMDKAALFIRDVANSIHLAPQRYCGGIKVAQGHYTWDIN